MNRRDFMMGTAAAGAAAVLPISILPEAKPRSEIIYRNITDIDRAILRKEFREEALQRYSSHFDFSTMEREYALELALLMDNQRLIREAVRNPYPKPRSTAEQLQLVFDVYSKFVGRHLVCIQTMSTPAEHILYEQIEKIGTKTHDFNGHKMDLPILEWIRKEQEITARSCRMKSCFDYPSADEIADELTREIMTDLRNHVATIATCQFPKDFEGLYVKLCEVSSVLHRKTLRSPPQLWIVTSPKIAHFINDQRGNPWPNGRKYTLGWDIRSFGVHKVGKINNNWEVYVDPLYPKNELLMGVRGRPTVEKKDWYYNAGYHYCPYIPWTEHVVLDPNSYWPRRMAIKRRARYVPGRWKGSHGGFKYYAKLVLK